MALKLSITRELLKEKIGDVNIFRHYFGEFDMNVSYHSVFRDDKKKSTGFYVSEHGSIIYNDFTTCEKYDFVHFVMKRFGLNYYKALQQIAIDFDLIPGTKSSDKKAIIDNIIPQKVKPKKEIDITITRFKKIHLNYWAQYHITEKELKENNVHPISKFTIKKEGEEFDIETTKDQLRFAYLYLDENGKGYTKIYSPYDENYKWVGNVPLSLVYGLNELPIKSDTLFITKSVKDCIVLKKFFTDCIAFQNESKDACTKETMRVLKKCYKRIILIFDNDKTGKFAAEWYKDNYNVEPVFMPDSSYEKYGIKDCSDFVKHYGLDVFKQYLQSLKLL